MVSSLLHPVGHNAAHMCGRFALISPPARLARYFEAVLDDDAERESSWNVAPTDPVLGVTVRHRRPDVGSERVLRPYRWGLVPSWATDPSAGSRLFNARAETVTTKSSFRKAFESHRILIPADGFYEWRKKPTGAKEPHYFTRADGAPLAFGGLSEWWKRGDAPPIYSCTIITVPASQDMDGIHDRMPLVLDPELFDAWLDPDNHDQHELHALLRASGPGTLTHHAVSPRVGSVRNNDPSLIDPA